MDTFIKKGFYTIGALKTNRILYPHGIKHRLSEFALHIRETDFVASIVTVGRRKYYVYRYEGNLNGIEKSSIGFRARDEGFVLEEMVSSTMQNTGFPDNWASL